MVYVTHHVTKESGWAQNRRGKLHGVEVEFANQHLKTGFHGVDDCGKVVEIHEVDHVEEFAVGHENDSENEAEAKK